MGDDKWGEIEYGEVSGLFRLHPNQRGKTMLNTVHHEWIHLLLPWAKEDWVREEANNLTNLVCIPEVLTQIGLFNNVIVNPLDES